MLHIEASDLSFVARIEDDLAPETAAAFRRLLPLDSRVIHARWSGEATWIPFGELDVGIGPENATAYPAAGQLLLYPGENAGQGPIVYFETDDIDAELAKVRDLGGQADDKQPIPGVGWFAGCKDPDGNSFSFFQSDESVAPPSA